MLVNFDIVEKCYLKIRKKIKNKNIIKNFEVLYNVNINRIVYLINNGYIMSNYNIFYIKEKKYRLILSNNIYDKIYSHIVNELILSKLDKFLIDSNVATRKNKGTSYGRKLLDKYLVKLKNKHDEFYILKFDIKKYFYNIDHVILLDKLSKYLNSKELFIIKNILDMTNNDYINKKIDFINNKHNLSLPYYIRGKGLSIGNINSQMLAIFYLNDFDHYVKETLSCKYYIRYMDDGIIIDNNKERLREVYKCLKSMINDYQLEFNAKTKIYKSSEGFEFLGIRYIIKNNVIKRKINKRILRKKIANINYSNYKFYKHYFKYLK